MSTPSKAAMEAADALGKEVVADYDHQIGQTEAERLELAAIIDRALDPERKAADRLLGRVHSDICGHRCAAECAAYRAARGSEPAVAPTNLPAHLIATANQSREDARQNIEKVATLYEMLRQGGQGSGVQLAPDFCLVIAGLLAIVIVDASQP